MEVLMPNYKLSNIESFSLNEVSKGTVIWVLHADKIPPHIGLSVDGQFYSLKANGKDVAAPIGSLLDIVERRQIALLCFRLSNQLTAIEIDRTYQAFDKTIPNEVTCLNPIKSILKHNESTKLIELLASLELEQRIERVFGVNIPDDFEGIKDYLVSDIHARLTLLNK